MTSLGNGLDDDCNSATDDDINDDDDSTMGNDLGRRNIAVHGVRVSGQRYFYTTIK